MDLDSLTTWVRVIAEGVVIFRKVMPMAMENLSIAQHQDTLWYAHTQGGRYKPKVRQFNVGDFMYVKRQPNDILDTPFGRTILRIKAIRPLGVLELQGANRCIIQNHSKNYVPCHLPNLNLTIITSTWIPPLDYPCQIYQTTNNANHVPFCDNCNGGYHLFCLKSKLTQVTTGMWYHSSCSHVGPWFLLRPCHFFFHSGMGGGGYMKISS